MNAKNEIIEMREELFEHLTTTHMICGLILILNLIVNGDPFTNTYPAINIRFFLLIGLTGLGVVLLYTRNSLLQRKYEFFSWIDLTYITFPLLVAVIALFTVKDDFHYSKTVLILPVIIAASVLGKTAGLVMSTVCTLILVFYQMAIESKSVIQALESGLIIISMMYVVGWFIGVLINSEVKHREQLKENLLSLQEEILKRKQMENEVARLDQLNLVGEMAAGIGHEIRNPMTTVRGFLQLLGGKKEYIQDKEYFDLMIEELDRGNSIITEFLSLARNKAVDLKTQNLNHIVKTLSPLIQADAMVSDKSVKVEPGDIPDLLLDEKEIRQLVLNLARNGLEAMSPGGNLNIRTVSDGDEVVLSVQDKGKGIEPDALEKIGTPFFTTKDYGTGLGLAVCYSIAARHNASIKVETGPTGTTFHVRFKLLDIC